MIIILLFIVGVIFTLAGGVLLLNLAHAPEGYEDAAGFHLGHEPGLSPKRPLIARSPKVRGPARITRHRLPAT
jgi:hypothetical protein